MKRPVPIESLSAAQARREHARLGEEIAAHDQRYYTDDAPSVSDAEYDALRQRYEALEAAFPGLATPESLTQKVGTAPSEKFAKGPPQRADALARQYFRRGGGARNSLPAFAAFLGSAKTHSSPSLRSPRSTGFPARCASNAAPGPGGNPRGLAMKARTSPPMSAPSAKFGIRSRAIRPIFSKCAARSI